METPKDETPSSIHIAIVGPCKVGKSTILKKVIENKFEHEYIPTKLGDVGNFDSNDGRYRFSIWDASGDEKQQSTTKTYCKRVNILVVVFDVTSKESFDKVERYYFDMRDSDLDNRQELLIGNKNDLAHRVVTFAEGQKFAHEHNMTYLDISAKEDDHQKLKDKFIELAKKIEYLEA